MGRRASRELAMKLLYQMEFQKEDKEDQIGSVLEENEATEKDEEYIRNVLEGVEKNKEIIDNAIEKYSKGWKLGRISKVDLSILRLAVFEINFREDIPLNVAINEAVELSKRYSSEESAAFVNGILGKFSNEKLVLELPKDE